MGSRHIVTGLVLMVFVSITVGDDLGRFLPRKAWWAKRVTDDVYTAGRPTLTQLKMATEVGFKSVISMFNFTSEDYLGEELIPTTDHTKDVVTRLAGLEFDVVLPVPGTSWQNLETTRRFAFLYSTLPKPILFHCGVSYSASFVTLLHFANVTTNDPDAVPNIDKSEFYRRTTVMGYDYAASATLRSLVVEVTGQDDIAVPPSSPEVSISNWNSLSWVVKPVFRNFYTAGAIQSNQLSLFDRTGFEVIVNNRMGVTIPPNDTPSQEEVILLNIYDGTGTYEGEGRQSETELLKNRIDPDKSNEFISPDSEVNYMSRNVLMFGDDIGYNEVLEQEYITDFWPFEYIHSPIGGQYEFDLEMWEAYKDRWLGLGEDKHVLVHCTSAYRSTVATLLITGYLYCKPSDWALERAHDLGYHFTAGEEDDIVDLFREVLDNNPTNCDQTHHRVVRDIDNAAAPSVVSTSVFSVSFMLLLTSLSQYM